MTELAPAAIEVTIENLDFNSARPEQPEASLEKDAGGSADHMVCETASLSASSRHPIYNTLEPAIAKQAEEVAGRIHAHIGSVKRCAAEIGKELLSVKDDLGHGNFGPWLEAEFAMTPRSAQNFMNIARMVETTDVALDLSDGALRLLAAPNAAPVRDKIIADIKAGKTAPTPKTVKKALAAAKSKPERRTKTSPTESASRPPAKQTAPANTEPAAITARVDASPVTASPSQTAAATGLVEHIKTKLNLAKFAKLYDIAGHEAFRKAMADALNAVVIQPRQTQQAA